LGLRNKIKALKDKNPPEPLTVLGLVNLPAAEI